MDAKVWKNEINHEVKPLRQNTFELNERGIEEGVEGRRRKTVRVKSGVELGYIEKKNFSGYNLLG